ncbi:hypothetical protein EVAR_41196_1 [Eumeta japonica]|uniref:Uncharacterized protein n=1 Tax=Eumeta variegata TaxID=151549 RepID=A0A4C1WSR1_EUMVA|nr:hypothetical protein EVAR_41196_1 [Eumeta japonica]
MFEEKLQHSVSSPRNDGIAQQFHIWVGACPIFIGSSMSPGFIQVGNARPESKSATVPESELKAGTRLGLTEGSFQRRYDGDVLGARGRGCKSRRNELRNLREHAFGFRSV